MDSRSLKFKTSQLNRVGNDTWEKIWKQPLPFVTMYSTVGGGLSESKVLYNRLTILYNWVLRVSVLDICTPLLEQVATCKIKKVEMAIRRKKVARTEFRAFGV